MISTPAADLQRHVDAVDAEGGGLVRLHFITPRDGAQLLLAAAAGDDWPLGLLVAISDCVRQIETAPKHAATLCLVCPRELRSVAGAMFCISVPDAATPRHAIGSAICPICAARSDLESRAMTALRGIWPDLRRIEVMPGPERVQ